MTNLNNDIIRSGHQGVSRTVERLQQWVQWKGMKKEVKKCINNCKPCQINKEKRKTRQPLVITTTSSKAFERVALDIVGPLTKSMNGYTHILTLQDDLTKFSAVYPLKATDATTIAKTFVEKFVCYFVFGIQPVMPSSFLKPPRSGYSYNDYVSDLRTCMQEARQMAKKHLIEAKIKAKSTTGYERMT
ncbi:hypothetical protein QTP88_029541 [Uroleucon formosanum]